MRTCLLMLCVGCVVAFACGGIEEPEETDLERQMTTFPGYKGCVAKCKPCPPNVLCVQSCTLVGNCTNHCKLLALCKPGYHWSETACRCLPDAGGQPCGTSHCSKDEYCCNQSCGICAPLGGGCIQIACLAL